VGQPPFRRGTDAATLFAHLEEEPPAPAGLEDVIAKALAKEPEQRYGTCAGLVEAAREPLGLGEPPRPRWWRAPVALALAGVVAIAFALGAYLAVGGGGGAASTRGSLVRIDPRTNRVAAQMAVGNDPSAVAADANGVWVANHNDGTIWRIDAHSDRVISQSPAHGVPADVAILPANAVGNSPSSPGSAVVVNGPSDFNVVEIDAASNTATAFGVPGGGPTNGGAGGPSGGAGTPGVSTGGSGIWVAQPDRQVVRFDDSTERLVQPVFIPPAHDERGDSYFSGIAVGEGGVWVLGDPNDPRLWRIDPASGRLAATIPLPFAPTDVAAGDGGVWVTSEVSDMLARIDPSTDEVAAAIPAGKGASAVAAGAGAVWVADKVGGTITRIDPRTLRASGTIKLNSIPIDLAVADGVVWVTARR
jgi:hypothetical protein